MKFPFGSLFVGSPLVPSLLAVLFVLGSCTVIRPGQVGMKQQLGVLSDKTRTQGVVWYFPFTSKVVKTSLQIQDIELSISLPSKEGLSVTSQISILYKVNRTKAPALVRNVGLEFRGIISNVIRSASADICAQYLAKDMHFLSEGLTDNILKLRSIEAFTELAKSPNAKVVVTDGQTPYLIKD